MADKKISQLTGATTPLAGTEVLPIVQGGSTVKVSAADVTAGRAVSVGSLTSAGAISGTTGGFSGAVTVTNAPVNLSNAFYYRGKLVAGTDVALIGRNSSDQVAIDPDGYGTVVGASGAFSVGGNGALTVTPSANNNTVFNEGGVNADFRIEGDTDQNLVFVDASADSVGIGTNAPWSFFTVGSGGTANPAATVTLHKSTVNEYRLKLTSSSFATGEWLGIGMGYSNDYMKVGLFAESLDGNGRSDFHIALQGDANSTNAALADKKLTVNYGGDVTVHSGNVKIGTAGKGIDFSGGLIWRTGTGTPEGAVTAPVGSLFTRTDGGANTTLYVKESGAGNTGWVAK